MVPLFLSLWLLQATAGAVVPVRPVITRMPAGQNLPELQASGGETTPLGLPIPLDSLRRLQQRVPLPAPGWEDTLAPPGLLAPPNLQGFQAIPYTAWFPPDVNLAVGFEDLVVTVNSQIAVFDRSGNLLSLTTLFNFFSPVNPRRAPFDPRVAFDHLDRRYLVLALVRSDSAALAQGDTFSYYLLAVSADSTATGSWYLWRLDARRDGSTPTANWADFPGLGYDDAAVYLTSNQFRFNGGFQYAKIRVLRKNLLYSGISATGIDFWNLQHSGGDRAFTVQPARSLSPVSQGYFLATDAAGGNRVSLWTITNPGTTPTLSRLATLTLQAYSPPPPAQQRGDTARLNTLDNRISGQVIYRNGVLYTAFAVAQNWGSGTRAALRWLQVQVNPAAVLTDLTWGLANGDYFYPALAVDRYGNQVVVFARSSASEYVGIRHTGWRVGATGPDGSAWLQQGTAPYDRRDRANRNRWGDYFGAALDPRDGNSIWIVGEYAVAGSTWATWVGQTAYLPDLRPTAPPGWGAAIVPRPTDDATPTFAPIPASLPGNDTVYLNFAWANEGENPNPFPFYTRLYLDNELLYTAYTFSREMDPGERALRINRGPFTVRGGRHTLFDSVDVENAVQESNEVNNFRSHQYVWSPMVLPTTPRTRPAPPPRVSPGGPYANCDGFSLGVPDGRWGAVALLPVDSTDDYDLLLYDDYVNATDGFDTYQEWSGRGAGWAEMVLVNRNAGAPATSYPGAIRYSGGHGPFVVQARTTFLTLTPSVAVAGDQDTLAAPYLGSGQILQLYGLRIPQPGEYRFTLEHLSGNGGLSTGIYDQGVPHARLTEALDWTTVTPGEQHSFEITFTDTGLYALAFWKPHSRDLNEISQARLIVALTPTNLRSETPPGWALPLVPRATNDASASSAPLPDSLPGNQPSTYLNFSILNEGPNPAGTYEGEILLDEEPLSLYWVASGHPPGQWSLGTNWGPYTIRGGRHTLRHNINTSHSVPETRMDDNTEVRQFVWSPLRLHPDAPQERPAPPVAGTGAQPNGDGFRFQRTGNYAQVIALLPRDPTDDYDLRLYADYAGPTSGFSLVLGWSAVGAGQTDFVVSNYLVGESEVFPAALRYAAGPLEPFVVEAQDAAGHIIGSLPYTSPPDTLAAGELVEIYEVYLFQNFTYRILLQPLGPAPMPGLFLFPASSTGYYAGRSGALASDLQGQILVTAPTSGWYPLVVAKPQSAQVDSVLRYQIHLERVPPGVWIGVQSEDWHLAANWSEGAVPGPADPATIPSWAPRMPRILDSVQVWALRIQSAARLELEGRLEITGDSLWIAGHLLASGACTLALPGNGQLLVPSGGHLQIAGVSQSEPAVITARTPGTYFALEVFAGGTLSAEYTVFEFLKSAGLNLRPGAHLTPSQALRFCRFQMGQPGPGSRLLTLNTRQTLVLEGVMFPENTWGSTYNAYKSLDDGNITFLNATGLFAGEAWESDPHGRIQWTVSFVPGDANGDGEVNDQDLVFLARYLYHGGAAPVPLLAGDVNHDCVVTPADLQDLAAFLYAGGSPPSPCGTLPVPASSPRAPGGDR